jgi:hypothetical protein
VKRYRLRETAFKCPKPHFNASATTHFNLAQGITDSIKSYHSLFPNIEGNLLDTLLLKPGSSEAE